MRLLLYRVKSEVAPVLVVPQAQAVQNVQMQQVPVQIQHHTGPQLETTIQYEDWEEKITVLPSCYSVIYDDGYQAWIFLQKVQGQHENTKF